MADACSIMPAIDTHGNRTGHNWPIVGTTVTKIGEEITVIDANIGDKADTYCRLLTHIKNMKTETKLLAVGITLMLTLLTTMMHATRATEHAVAEDTATDDLTAPNLPQINMGDIESTFAISASDIIRYGHPEKLALRSSVALIMDAREGVVLYGHNTGSPRPIASLTKLMTAMVILDAGLPLDEPIEITRADRDTLRGTRSRLQYGAIFTRYDLLQAALGASDNRAAAALARTYPGGAELMFQTMNTTAQKLGMTQTRYADASGLHSGNISTAADLVKLIAATSKHPLFQTLTTNASFHITDLRNGTNIPFFNTNRLIRQESWDIGLSKTGYTAAAGSCLVMQTTIGSRPLVIVLLNSWGKFSRLGDSNRIRDWLLSTERKVQHINSTVASTQS